MQFLPNHNIVCAEGRGQRPAAISEMEHARHTIPTDLLLSLPTLYEGWIVISALGGTVESSLRDEAFWGQERSKAWLCGPEYTLKSA